MTAEERAEPPVRPARVPRWGAREVVVIIAGMGWLSAVGAAAWRTGTVPAELWAILAGLIGGILMAFRVDEAAGGRHRRDDREDDR